MAEVKDLRSHRTKNAILDALYELLEKKNFNKITVNDICIKASVSRPTFYMYFEDKYDLVRYGIELIREEINRFSKDNNFRDVVAATISAMESSKKLLRRLMLSDNRELDIMLKNVFIDGYTKELESLQKQGQVFAAPVEMLAVFLAMGTTGIIVAWVSGGFDYSAEEMTEYIIRLAESDFR